MQALRLEFLKTTLRVKTQRVVLQKIPHRMLRLRKRFQNMPPVGMDLSSYLEVDRRNL